MAIGDFLGNMQQALQQPENRIMLGQYAQALSDPRHANIGAAMASGAGGVQSGLQEYKQQALQAKLQEHQLQRSQQQMELERQQAEMEAQRRAQRSSNIANVLESNTDFGNFLKENEPAQWALESGNESDIVGVLNMYQRHMAAQHPQAAGSIFGSGVTGRSLEYITQLAPLIQAGQATPEQERVYQAAVSHYQQPRTTMDPFTQQPMQITPQLPPFAQGGAPAIQGAQPGQRPAQQQPVQQPGAQQRPAQPTDARQPEQQPIPGQGGAPTLYDMTPELLGVASGLRRTVGDLPLGIGDQWPAEAEAAAAQYSVLLQDRVGRQFQESPRYAQGEWTQILKKLEMGPKVIGSETARQSRLISVDRLLGELERNAFTKLAEGTLTADERRKSMEMVNQIPEIRAMIGVPPQFNSIDEALQQPSGTRFLDPNGVERFVP